MATTKKKTVAKKTTKKVTRKATKKPITFNKYSIWFQTGSLLLVIAALALNICNCIDMNIMLDLFGLSVIFLAFSLFPKKGTL
jgi:hypothetical protein